MNGTIVSRRKRRHLAAGLGRLRVEEEGAGEGEHHDRVARGVAGVQLGHPRQAALAGPAGVGVRVGLGGGEASGAGGQAGRAGGGASEPATDGARRVGRGGARWLAEVRRSAALGHVRGLGGGRGSGRTVGPVRGARRGGITRRGTGRATASAGAAVVARFHSNILPCPGPGRAPDTGFGTVRRPAHGTAASRRRWALLRGYPQVVTTVPDEGVTGTGSTAPRRPRARFTVVLGVLWLVVPLVLFLLDRSVLLAGNPAQVIALAASGLIGVVLLVRDRSDDPRTAPVRPWLTVVGRVAGGARDRRRARGAHLAAPVRCDARRRWPRCRAARTSASPTPRPTSSSRRRAARPPAAWSSSPVPASIRAPTCPCSRR